MISCSWRAEKCINRAWPDILVIVMEGCDVDIISKIAKTPRAQVQRILKFESDHLEITRSLLNLLYNAVIVGSLPVSSTQKAYFDSNAEQVRHLIGTSKSIIWKKQELTENSALTINIAALCPTVAGSSLPKTATNNSQKPSRKRPRKKPMSKLFKKLRL